MKRFFEQYGGVALGILALLVLIAMITPVGNIIKTSLQETVQKFSSSISTQTDERIEAFNEIVLSAQNYKGTVGNALTENQYNAVIAENQYFDSDNYIILALSTNYFRNFNSDEKIIVFFRVTSNAQTRITGSFMFAIDKEGNKITTLKQNYPYKNNVSYCGDGSCTIGISDQTIRDEVFETGTARYILSNSSIKNGLIAFYELNGNKHTDALFLNKAEIVSIKNNAHPAENITVKESLNY